MDEFEERFISSPSNPFVLKINFYKRIIDAPIVIWEGELSGFSLFCRISEPKYIGS